MTHQDPPPTRRPPLRRAVRGGIGLIIIGLVTLLVAEIMVRIIQPTPPIQVYRQRENQRIHTLPDGTVVWNLDDSTELTRTERPSKPSVLYNLSCGEGDDSVRRVFLIGDSILWSMHATADAPAGIEKHLSVRLQNLLNPAGQKTRVCVHNLSGPAYGHIQKFALLNHFAATYPPDVILWGFFSTETNRYAHLGEQLYEVSRLPLDKSGLPNPLALAAGLNAWLLNASRLYEHTVLSWARDERDGTETRKAYYEWAEHLSTYFPTLKARAAELDAQLVMVLCPPLGRPFAETATNLPDFLRQANEYFQVNGMDALNLAAALVHDDYLTLRSDACCHYNQQGHQRLAEIFAGVITERIGDL